MASGLRGQGWRSPLGTRVTYLEAHESVLHATSATWASLPSLFLTLVSSQASFQASICVSPQGHTTSELIQVTQTPGYPRKALPSLLVLYARIF